MNWTLERHSDAASFRLSLRHPSGREQRRWEGRHAHAILAHPCGREFHRLPPQARLHQSQVRRLVLAAACAAWALGSED